MKKNADIKGWLTIDGTEINNPVYQSTNNTYYQSHNMLKEKSRYGTLFFDKNSIIEKENSSKNITVYGHNTTNGTMFDELDSYHSLSFYKSNPVIKLKTLYQQNEYLVFAVFITNADPKDDNGQIYNYARAEFKDSQDFNAFINEAKKRSLITVPINISDEAEILTLSTRSNEFENARFVVMAVKITTENFIGLADKATLNDNTKHTQAWYNKHGLLGYKDKESESASVEGISSNASENTSTNITSDNAESSLENESDVASSQSAPSSSIPSSSIPSSSIPSSSVNSSNSNPTSIVVSSSAPVSSTVSNSAASSSQAASSTEPTACNHVPGKYEHKDATQHIYKCANCGTPITEVHSFTLEKAEPAYLVSPATCASPAIYLKSCQCLIQGTETFESGSPTYAHIPSTDFKSDDVQHWNPCQNAECAEKLNAANHNYVDNKCICGKEIPAQ